MNSSKKIQSAADVRKTLTGFMKSDFCDLDKSETEEFKQFLADEKGVYEEDYSKLRPLSEWLEFLSDFEELKEVISSEDIQSAKVVRGNSIRFINSANGERDLFSNSFLDNKVKLTLELCDTPHSSTTCCKYTNNGSIYFYASKRIIASSKETDTLNVKVFYLPNSREPVYFREDEEFINDLPKEVYVESTFNPQQGILLTISSSLLVTIGESDDFVYDYLASKETYKIKNLSIPDTPFVIKLNGKYTESDIDTFNYFKKVCRNRSNNAVYLTIQLSYLDRPSTAHIVDEELSSIISFSSQETDVFANDEIVTAVIKFKKDKLSLIVNNFSRRNKMIKSSMGEMQEWNTLSDDEKKQRDEPYNKAADEWIAKQNQLERERKRKSKEVLDYWRKQGLTSRFNQMDREVNSMVKSAYTREDYDRFDEFGNFIPYNPTEEELAKKDEIKKVLKQELSDAYEPDPMDDYAGYDSTDARIDMACERVAKQFNVDTDFVEEIAGEIEYDLWIDGNKEWEWVNTPGNLTSEQYDQYMNGELDVRPLMLKSSRQIKSEYSKYAMSYDGKDGIRIVDRFTGKTFDTFHLDAEDYEKDRLLSWLLYQFNHRVNKNEVDKNTRDILTKYGINIDNLALVWDGPESFHINCSKQIKSSPNFKKFTADEIFDSFQMEELIHTVFMDREECKNAKCGMNEFSDLMYDVLPGYLGVYTADDVREVCRRAKNPKAKAFLEAFETALENAKFVDKFYNSIKVHKKAASSHKLVKSDAASEQKLKEDLIRQGYTEDEATQIVEQRKPENVESSKMFTKDNNWKYNTAVLPTSKSMLKSFFRNGSWSWDTTIALVGTINGGRPYVIFGAKGSYPKLEKGRGLFHDQTLNDIGWFTFDRYCNDDSVFDIPEAKYAVLK